MKIAVGPVAKYAGLATVVVEWSALFLYYVVNPIYFGHQYPISYFATLPVTKWVFTVGYVLAALCFWVFVKHYLRRHYAVPLGVFGISLSLFACTGIFPFDFSDALSLCVHSILAASAGLLFLLGMYLFARKASDRRVYFVTNMSVIMSLIFSILFILQPQTSPYVFLFEVSSWLALQLWTIWISFYTYRKNGIKKSTP